MAISGSTSTTIVAAKPCTRVLGQQREVEHDHPIGVGVRGDLPLDLGLHRRVDDRVQVGEGVLVVEHDRRDRGPIERTVGGDDLVPEPCGHLGEHGAPR